MPIETTWLHRIEYSIIDGCVLKLRQYCCKTKQLAYIIYKYFVLYGQILINPLSYKIKHIVL